MWLRKLFCHLVRIINSFQINTWFLEFLPSYWVKTVLDDQLLLNLLLPLKSLRLGANNLGFSLRMHRLLLDRCREVL